MAGRPRGTRRGGGVRAGGPWDDAPPSAALAAALQAAAGPGSRYEGADLDALVGMTRQWAAIESWAAAEQLATLRAMTRHHADPHHRPRHRADLPQDWDDSLNYEVAAALAMGPVSAGNLAALARALGTRLQGTGRLLAAGLLTRAKAKLITAIFEPLTDTEAARAESLLLGDLPGKTYYQVERLAWRAALAIAPDTAQRRRKAAERDHARVTLFREESGTAGLSGRDLPTAQALSGHAHILDRAREYAASGAFPGHTQRALEALAYLHLLNDVTTADAIAYARTTDDVLPPDNPPDDDPPANDDPPDDNPPDDNEPGGDSGPGGDSRGEGNPGDGGPSDNHPGNNKPDGNGPIDDSHGGTGWRALPEVTVPLATLLGLAARPGENRLLGSLDPAITRDLAAAAARSPSARWELTVVDACGHAARHGVARPVSRHGSPAPPGTPARAFPARINITVTEELLRRLAAPPRPGAPPDDWLLTPRSPDSPGDPWHLTLPGGTLLVIRLDTVPVYDCDHRYQVGAYLPGDRLRRLVNVRDQECTFPTCSRPAHQCDFEHAVPYDQGGATCACNAGARSRRCHQVKQAPGWSVSQPQPGYHQWTTPTGRTYVQEPWRYTA